MDRQVSSHQKKFTFLHWTSKWPIWSSHAAASWSLLYFFLGLYWLLGGAGYPFGENDAWGEYMGSLLYHLPANGGAAIITFIGGIGVIIAVAMTLTSKKQLLNYVLIGFSWKIAFILLLLIPDVRIVQTIAYVLTLHVQMVDWPVINQIICMIGGIFWGAAAFSYQRRIRNACQNCGRKKGSPDQTHTYQSRKMVAIFAILLPLPYGIIRWLWAVGIPFGVSDETWILISQSFEDKIAEFILGGMHIGGALLTLALIQKWGEVFPKWCLFLSGKRIPVWLVATPATVAAIVITVAGFKTTIQMIFGLVDRSIVINATNWAELGPIFLWLPWGIS